MRVCGRKGRGGDGGSGGGEMMGFAEKGVYNVLAVLMDTEGKQHVLMCLHN